MATARKPAARKPAATSRPRKAATKKVVAPVATSHDTPEQIQAKVTAYTTLLAAGVEIPAQLHADVMANVAEEARLNNEAEKIAIEAERQEIKELAETKGPDYMLNTYNAPLAIRLERHDKKRRIELKALGQRGDMHPITDEDKVDPIFIANLELGLFEVINAGQAMVRSRKQVHNMSRTHTPLAILRNEMGEPYADGAFKVELEYNEQGVVVASVDPNALSDQMDKGAINAGGLTRVRPEQVSQFVPTGGNPAIISQSPPFGATAEMIRDDIARRGKSLEGPSAGLGGLTVLVDPVQRT